MVRRILVPLDGSAPAQHAFDVALSLAERYAASLVLVHVIDQTPVMPYLASLWAEVQVQLEDTGKALLLQAHEAATAKGIASETHLEMMSAGRVSVVICDKVSSLHCDLVVMGSHGRRGLERALLGSDAERVVRHSPVHVLVVRSPELRQPSAR